jgi:hypothetical protein
VLVSAVPCTALVASSASAETPGCDLPVADHCYAILQGSGTQFKGMGATWNRANMSQDYSTPSDPTFLDSEEWLGATCGLDWVELGNFAGYDPFYGARVYESFVGWQGAPGYAPYGYAPFQVITPNNSTIDSFYLTLNPVPNSGWIANWDGNQYNTPRVGFGSGACIQMGAEVATPVGHAQTFNMYSDAETLSNVWGTWGAQAGVFKPPGIAGTVLNGVTYQNSEWSWNTVQP